jgi:hypothetical protein
MSDLSPQQIAAALAEIDYRRASADQTLKLSSLPRGATDLAGVKTPEGMTENGGYYYDDTTGFVGRVVEVNGKVYVAFRGTDFIDRRVRQRIYRPAAASHDLFKPNLPVRPRQLHQHSPPHTTIPRFSGAFDITSVLRRAQDVSFLRRKVD